MKNTLTRMNKLASFILILSLLSFSSASYANNKVGHVIFSNGDISARNSGETRLLKRGSSVREGDMIKTPSGTIAQLRMTDGALVSLKANTEFSIDKYQYSENKKSNSSIFNLIKGGFRTITGLIGKLNKNNYRVRTAVATIGIRGTHYGLTLCNQGDCSSEDAGTIEDGLYGSVIDGEIYTDNQSGIHTFSNDEYFHIASNDSKPRNLLKPPGVIFQQGNLKKLKRMKDNKHKIASLLQKRHMQQSDLFLATIEHKKELVRNQLTPQFEATRDTNTSLNSFPLPANTGNFLAFSLTEIDLTALPAAKVGTLINNGASNQLFLNAVALDNGQLIPVAAQQTVLPDVRGLFIADALPIKPTTIKIPTTNVAVGWGRWSNQYVTTINDKLVPHVGHLHYIVASDVTSIAQLAGLTGTANYTTIGGTQATDLVGNVAPGFANVTMAVDFDGGAFAPGITSFNIITNVGGVTYEAGTSALVDFPTALTSGLNLAGTGACSTCLGNASIAFFGLMAEGAGTTYTIKDGPTNVINGAAILTR